MSWRMCSSTGCAWGQCMHHLPTIKTMPVNDRQMESSGAWHANLPLGDWTPVRPSAPCSLAPEDWFRGEGYDVGPAKRAALSNADQFTIWGTGQSFTNTWATAPITANKGLKAPAAVVMMLRLAHQVRL